MTAYPKWLAAAAASTAIVAAPAGAATPWIKVESPHFTVYSNSSAKLTSAYVTRLEQYRYVLSGFYGITPANELPAPRLSVYFVNSFKDLKQTWPEASNGVMGYYKDCQEGAGALGLNQDDTVRATKDAKSQVENTSQAILFHEYAHTFMMQNSEQRFPPWFVEGFAEFYSTTKLQGEQAVVGMSFTVRMYSLMYAQFPIKYEDLLRDSWRPKKGSADRFIDAFYAQSWLLTHWILSDPARREQFDTFVADYRKGSDPVVAFEAAFGIKVKDLKPLLDKYVDKNLMATLYKINAMPQPELTVTNMPASADKLLLWDFASRTCATAKSYPALLPNIRTEAARFPGDEYAGLVLARAEIIIGDEDKALDFLTPYLKAHPNDADAHFMTGQTWFLMTAHKTILEGETAESQIKKARKSLSTAYGLDPLNAANLYYYALALDYGSETPKDNAINAAMQAHYLIPSVEEYSLTAADMLVRRDRMDEAKSMLVPLSTNPHNPRAAAWISRVIARIDEKASREDVLKALHGKDKAGKDETGEGEDGDADKDKPAK